MLQDPVAMAEYKHNKLKTAFEICSKIENWWSAWDLRLRKTQNRQELLRFKNGLNVVCRGGTRDWDVVHELFFMGGYAQAFEHLKNSGEKPVVLDLGGNIGLFSLLAAHANPGSTNPCL